MHIFPFLFLIFCSSFCQASHQPPPADGLPHKMSAKCAEMGVALVQALSDPNDPAQRTREVVHSTISELCGQGPFNFHDALRQLERFQASGPAPTRPPFEPQFRPAGWYSQEQVVVCHMGTTSEGGCLRLKEGNNLATPQGVEYLRNLLDHPKYWSYQLDTTTQGNVVHCHYNPPEPGQEIRLSIDSQGTTVVTCFQVGRGLIYTTGNLKLELPPYNQKPDYLEFAAPQVTGSEGLTATRGVHVYQNLVTPPPGVDCQQVELSGDPKEICLVRAMALKLQKLLDPYTKTPFWFRLGLTNGAKIQICGSYPLLGSEVLPPELKEEVAKANVFITALHKAPFTPQDVRTMSRRVYAEKYQEWREDIQFWVNALLPYAPPNTYNPSPQTPGWIAFLTPRVRECLQFMTDLGCFELDGVKQSLSDLAHINPCIVAALMKISHIDLPDYRKSMDNELYELSIRAGKTQVDLDSPENVSFLTLMLERTDWLASDGRSVSQPEDWGKLPLFWNALINMFDVHAHTFRVYYPNLAYKEPADPRLLTVAQTHRAENDTLNTAIKSPEPGSLDLLRRSYLARDFPGMQTILPKVPYFELYRTLKELSWTELLGAHLLKDGAFLVCDLNHLHGEDKILQGISQFTTKIELWTNGRWNTL